MVPQFSCGILKMVGPKKQDFWPRIKSVDELPFVKKCQNRTFKVNFQCQKSTEFKKRIIYEYQFRRPFFVKTSFSKSNFWTTLFSKVMPNFWRTGAPRILKIQRFPLSILIFGQKFCFSLFVFVISVVEFQRWWEARFLKDLIVVC